ncbi:MAG: AAA family ATPase [Thermodesulfobacteriota bacterium]
MSDTEAKAESMNLPSWAGDLAALYKTGVSQMFLLSGNVDDLVFCPGEGGPRFLMLPEFLASQVFGEWDLVIQVDQVRGVRALSTSPRRLTAMNALLSRHLGSPEHMRTVRNPAKALAALDHFLENALLMEKERPSVAILFDQAHFMAPESSVSYLSGEAASCIATLVSWARSPYFKKVPFAFCLISERLSDLNRALVQSPHTASISVPFPRVEERKEYIASLAGDQGPALADGLTVQTVAQQTAGLSLVQLAGLVRKGDGQKPLTARELSSHKKRMIESQCGGLVEFVSPKRDLSAVVGHGAAKKRLQNDAGLILGGRYAAAPMGYLICGPVGTGKTYLAECYAGSVGLPCLKLRNFRSKYVGETESNLERILTVLKSMGPLAVIIDEADAMLGDRDAEGDSGTSARVFGALASQMGDTSFRGRIVWFLLTCRPDLLPIDLKRQGRCEVHIPLFGPEKPEDFREMVLAMARKNGFGIAPEDASGLAPSAPLSGADIEGVVTRARRLALLAQCEAVTREHLAAALENFLPSFESAEKELQTIAAIMECSEKDLLPERLQNATEGEENRRRLLARFRDLQREIE